MIDAGIGDLFSEHAERMTIYVNIYALSRRFPPFPYGMRSTTYFVDPKVHFMTKMTKILALVGIYWSLKDRLGITDLDELFCSARGNCRISPHRYIPRSIPSHIGHRII